MVPPMSSTLRCAGSSEITALPHSASNSDELASPIWHMLRANSMICTCMPRQMPNTGILLRRAVSMAATMPSMPRTPKPPGTSSAS